MEKWKGTAIIITLDSPPSPNPTPGELECTDDKGERGARGENFLQLKDGSSAKPLKGVKLLQKKQQKKTGLTSISCGQVQQRHAAGEERKKVTRELQVHK